MKKFVLTILALTFAASPAFAQYGDISGYADQAGTSCSITDSSPGLREVFILIKHTSGVSGASFMVTTTGSTMSWIADTIAGNGIAIGSSQTGIDVTFPCVTGDGYFMKVQYFGSGTSAPCSYFSVVPHPLSDIPGRVVILDCNLPFGALHPVAAGQAIINPVPVTCDCNVPVSESTWGGIKALYR